jgi:hypothetical protein
MISFTSNNDVFHENRRLVSVMSAESQNDTFLRSVSWLTCIEEIPFLLAASLLYQVFDSKYCGVFKGLTVRKKLYSTLLMSRLKHFPVES